MKSAKRNVSKKKVLRLAIILLVAIIAIVAVVSIANRNKESDITELSAITDQELAMNLTYQPVEDGDEKVYKADETTGEITDEVFDFVEFDAFFLADLDGDGYADGVRGACSSIDSSATLYMQLNVVNDGYLKDGKIEIFGDNVTLKTLLVADSVIKDNYISNDTTEICLNDVNKGTEKLIYGQVLPDIGKDISKYSSEENYIVFTGTHISVDAKGNVTETPVKKVIYFTVDWYGEVNSYFYDTSETQRLANSSVVDEENDEIRITFTLWLRESYMQLLLEGAHVYFTVPAINGYNATSVTVSQSRVESTYDPETGEFSATRWAELDGSTIISQAYAAYYNDGFECRETAFTITITYPYDVYPAGRVELPIYGYFTGYNNPNEDVFENPIVSNTSSLFIQAEWGEGLSVRPGNYRSYDKQYVISKKAGFDAYNGKTSDEKDTYQVRWNISSNVGSCDGYILEEDPDYGCDAFYTLSTNTSTPMIAEDGTPYISNIGIYFVGATSLLGEDGWIKVYDNESDELIVTFTYNGSGDTINWNSYDSSSNIYYFYRSVDHLRVETSATSGGVGFQVYCIKEIDDELIASNIDLETYEIYDGVYSYLRVTFKHSSGDTYGTDRWIATYEQTVSMSGISIDPDAIVTSAEQENVIIEISTYASYSNTSEWQNAEFLIELPAAILDVSINSITISGTKYEVDILAYEIVEIDGQLFIKISTSNEVPTSYTITLDVNMTADPRVVTTESSVVLWTYNELMDNYYSYSSDTWDLDGDGSTDDRMGKTTASLDLVSPSTLIINEEATDYNAAGETVIAPQIASVDKTEASTVTIVNTLLNNYESTISEVVILGKIPYAGNTYVLNSSYELGSDYDTKITSIGISLDETLAEVATVYYSTNENATKDLSDPSNGWVTAENVENWDDVKVYLIDLGDYVLDAGEELTFTYVVTLPENVSYNDVTYCTFAAYFCLDTDAGKFATKTETSKLGVRIERKFNLSLTKTKDIGDDIPVQSAYFSVTAEGEATSKTGYTDANGVLTLDNLYVEKLYTLKEIKTPSNYESNDIEIQFMLSVDDDGDLYVTFYKDGVEVSSSDNYVGITQATETEKGVLLLEVENISKYTIVLEKVDQDSENSIRGVRYYLLTNEDEDTKVVLTTDANGKITIPDLSRDVIYTLVETDAKGYYVDSDPIKFSVTKDGDSLVYNDLSNSFSTTPIVTIGTGSGSSSEDTITFEVTNEAVPTYNLRLIKYQKDTDETLAGAQFKITGDGIDGDGETYSTDANGEILIEGLYEYVEGRDEVTGVYTITEIKSPTGFCLDESELSFYASRNSNNELVVTVEQDGLIREIVTDDATVQDITVEDSTSDMPTVVIGIDNKPLFELIKTGDNGEPLEGVTFIIYKIDDDLNIVDFGRDINGNYVGDKIDDSENKYFNATIGNNGWYYASTTDSDGKITYGLESGLYKVVEIETIDTYNFDDDIENRTWYFGIDENKDQETNEGVVYDYAISGDSSNKIISSTATSDGVLACGYYMNSVDIDGDNYADLKNLDSTDGMIIKYNTEGEVEFTTTVTGIHATAITDIIETSSGFAVTGYFESEKLYVNGLEIDITGNGSRNSMILTFDNEGNFVNGSALVGDLSNEYNSIIQLSTGEFIVGGNYKSTSFMSDGDDLTDSAIDRSGMVVCYSSKLDWEWSRTFIGDGESEVVDLAKSPLNDGFVVVGNVIGSLTYQNASTTHATITDSEKITQYCFAAKYDNNGSAGECKTFGGSDTNRVTSVTADASHGFIVTGAHQTSFTIDSVTVPASKTTNNYTSMMIMFDTNLNAEFANTLSGGSAYYPDMITSVAVDSAGEKMIIGGYTYNTNLAFDGSNNVITTKSGNSTAFIAEYEIDSDAFTYNNWYKLITGSNMEEVTTVSMLSSGQIFAGGWFDGTNLDVDQDWDEPVLTNTLKQNGFVVEYGEVITSPSIASMDAIEIENELKTYKITTEVEGGHGTITGSTQNPYEVVKAGYDSVLDIIATPDEGYEVLKITVNGEEISYTINADGTVLLDKFICMTEDKHIVVSFSNVISNIEVHHVYVDTDGNITTTEVADAEYYKGNVGDEYTTEPYITIDLYQLATYEDFSEDTIAKLTSDGYMTSVGTGYYIPNNASGIYIEDETIVVTYYYVDLQVPLTVHHYIIDTEDHVPLADESLAEDENYTGIVGEAYETSELSEYELSERYELVETAYPTNASGTYTSSGVVVTYYYQLVERNLNIVKYDSTHSEKESVLEGITFEIKDADGTVVATCVTDTDGNINVTLEAGTYTIQEKETLDGYKLDETVYTINVKRDGIYENTEILDSSDDSYILELSNEKIPAQVIVYHYVYDPNEANPYTEIQVPSNDGGVVEIEYINGFVGEDYTTYVASNIDSGYRFYESSSNTTGTMTEDTIYVYYYYKGSQKFAISKVDENGNALSGVVFEVLDSERNVIATYETDSNGKVNISLNFGEYIIREKSTVYGYNLNEEEYTIVVDSTGISIKK